MRALGDGWMDHTWGWVVWGDTQVMVSPPSELGWLCPPTSRQGELGCPREDVSPSSLAFRFHLTAKSHLLVIAEHPWSNQAYPAGGK